MDYRILIFSKKELKIILFGTMIGGILQVICSKYIKDHPELLNSQNPKKVKQPGLRRFVPPGGAFIEIAGAKVVINIAAVITYVSKKGALAGLILTSSGVFIKKIPVTAVSTYVRNSLPVTHSDLEKKKFLLVDGKKISLDQCDQNLTYLFKILVDKNIPFTEKKELSYSILMNHLGLKTANGRIRFILCMVTILHIFSINDVSSYLIIMGNLIKAVKEGRISKRLARLIIRKLIRKGVTVDPELIEVAY